MSLAGRHCGLINFAGDVDFVLASYVVVEIQDPIVFARKYKLIVY